MLGVALPLVGFAALTGSVALGQAGGRTKSPGGARGRLIKPRATIATARRPGSIVTQAGGIWVDTARGVQRIDPKTNRVVATVPTPANPVLTVGAGAVWAADFDHSVVRRIDPITNKVVATIKVGANPAGITFANGSVWVANHRGGSVSRIDSATNTVVATIKAGETGTQGPQPIEAGFGDIWVGAPNIYAVVRIDPVSNKTKAEVDLSPSLAAPCGTIAAVPSMLWIGSCADFPTVTGVNPKTNRAAVTVDVNGWTNGAVVVGGKAWYAISTVDYFAGGSPRLARIEPGRKKPTAIRLLARSVDPAGMLLAFGSLWVADNHNGKLLRFPAGLLK